MDGWITIGTKIDTDKFDRQISELENKIQKEEANAIDCDVQINIKQSQIEKAKKAFEKLPEEIDKTTNEVQQLSSELSNLKPDTEEFNALNEKLTEANMKLIIQGNLYKRFPTEISKQEREVDALKRKQEKSNEAIEKYKQKINNLKMDKHKKDIDEAKKSVQSLGKSFQKSVLNVGKLAVGIIGIRSAIGLLKSASSDLASYDEQYATNIDYVKFALTSVIAPVLRDIVNLAGQLLSYVNAIANAWFGLNLFGNASVKDFQQMKKSAGGVAGAVKEIKKQLAGFDEINVLNEDSSSGGGGGSSGILPTFDVSQLNAETPEWLQWIIDHKAEILAVLSGIASAIKLISWGLGIIKSLGIGVAIAGIVYAISGLIDYLKDPIFENFGKIFIGIGTAILGVAIAIGSLPTAFVGAIVIIWGLIVKYWNQIKEFFQGIVDWLTSKADWVRENFGDFIGNIYDSIMLYMQMVIDLMDDIMQGIKRNFDDIIAFVKDVFEGDWEDAWKRILNIATSPIEFLKSLFTRVFTFFRDLLNNFITFLSGKRDWIQSNFGNTIVGLYDMFIKNLSIASNILTDFINSIRTHFDNVMSFIKNVFTGNWQGAWENLGNIVSGIFGFMGRTIDNILKGIWNTITGWATAIGTAVGDAIGGAFKNVINSVLWGVEYVLNGPIRSINGLISAINEIPGVNLGYLSTFSLPRLAVGGIVNMPNTGTLIGGAIAGESGREGVLPLTDSQTMAELGREIGRWITINANITNTMNGRVISRELKQIQNEQSFAYNT